MRPLRRRVVALSAQDRRRVARGELPEDRAEELRRRGLDALSEARSRGSSGPGAGGDQDEGAARRRGNDDRLLADVPPHWGGD